MYSGKGRPNGSYQVVASKWGEGCPIIQSQQKRLKGTPVEWSKEASTNILPRLRSPIASISPYVVYREGPD